MPSTLTRLSAFLNLNFPEDLLERMTSQDQPLRRYGEFARRNGQLVEEPSDFAQGKTASRRTWLNLPNTRSERMVKKLCFKTCESYG